MKNYFKNLKNIVKFNNKTFFYLISLFVILTFLEVLSLSIIYPFIKFVLSGELFFFEEIFSRFNFEVKNITLFLCVFLILTFILKNLFSYFIRIKLVKYCWNRLIFLRTNLSNFYISIPFEEFLNKGKVNIITSTNDYTRSVMQGFEAFLKLIGELIILISIIVYLFILNFEVTIIISLLMMIFAYVYYRIYSKRLIFNGNKNIKGEKVLNSNLITLFSGFQEIKAINKEDFFLKRLKFGASEISEANISNQKINLIPRYFLEVFLITFGSLYILYSYLNNISGDEIVSTLSVYSFAALRLLPGLVQINLSINEINYSKPAISFISKDLIELKNYREDKIDSKNILKKKQIFSHLELKNLKFKYKNSEENIIDDINLKINKNNLIGITGESGIGKSSLIGIMTGLLKQTNGNYNLYNEQNEIIQKKNLISYLGQEPIIIDGSIQDNIVLSENENDFDEKKILDAIKFSDLDRFIFKLPKKEKTLVGEKGITLSIGQKQRLALARCYYANKQIMILDEPSSALDEKTQDNIFNNLKFLKGKKTIIVITHNKRTLKYCDKVYEFSDKKLKVHQ